MIPDGETSDRMEALRWIQRMHDTMPDDRYTNLDIDQEREEALAEKYGYLCGDQSDCSTGTV